MGTMRIGLAISLGVLLTLTVGCQSNKPEESMGGMDQTPATEAPAAEAQPVEPAPMPKPVEPQRPEVRGDGLWKPAATPGSNMERVDSTFYFDFDQAIVKRGAFDALGEHASYLAANPGVSIRLEGNADERGTREYNLALGERRANAVAAYLRAQGVSANQIEVISYGEEKPVALGHDEASWAKNRRVDLIYK